ncbi:MAG: ABC transporter substrate-binding protein [Omnitrophica WOR_2 bacterium]
MMQAKKFVFTILLMAAIVLAGCQTATPQAPAVEPTQTTAAVEQPTQAPAVEQPTQAPAAATPTEAPKPTEPPAAGKKVVTFLWTQEFDSLNPMYTNMWFSTVTEQLWNCWAWTYDEKNVAHPLLVKEIPTLENGGISKDFKTITMKLADNIKWSDGEAITADDFVFTYQMWVDKKNTVSSTYPYEKVASVEAPDKQTVVMKFAEPFAPWEATLWKGLLPAHVLKPVFEKEGSLDKAAYNTAPTVGCGPYVFKEWQSGSFANFVASDNYWLGKPKIDEVFIRFVPDDTAMVKALQAGDGDLGAFIPYSEVPTLKDAGINLVTEPSGYNEGLFFLINKDKGHPALLDVNVRKAIAMSLNLDKLNQDLHYGLTKPAASYWDALPFWNNPPMENYKYDPEGAKKLLDDAGWKVGSDGVREKDGKKLELKWGTTIREDRQNVQAIGQQELAAVGIKVNISSNDSDVFFADVANNGPAASGQLDIMEWSDAPAFPDPDIYYWLCSEIPSADSPSGTNWFYLCDEELDSLIKKQASELDVTARQKIVEQINTIFHDKVYWLGLWQDPDVWAFNNKLQNVKISGVTPFFNIMEWDITQ